MRNDSKCILLYRSVDGVGVGTYVFLCVTPEHLITGVSKDVKAEGGMSEEGNRRNKRKI